MQLLMEFLATFENTNNDKGDGINKIRKNKKQVVQQPWFTGFNWG
jgi:hypothetical protein